MNYSKDNISPGATKVFLLWTLSFISTQPNFYRPRSEASEGYIFTGVCHFNSGGGGGEWIRDQVTTPSLLSPPLGPGHNTSLHPSPGTWSQHLPPPPGAWSQHLPPPPGLCAGGRYTSYWNAFLSDEVVIVAAPWKYPKRKQWLSASITITPSERGLK